MNTGKSRKGYSESDDMGETNARVIEITMRNEASHSPGQHRWPSVAKRRGGEGDSALEVERGVGVATGVEVIEMS